MPKNVLTRTESGCGGVLYGENVLDGTENSFCGKVVGNLASWDVQRHGNSDSSALSIAVFPTSRAY